MSILERLEALPALTAADIHRLLACDDPIILEVGAHHGEDTLEFLREFAAIKLHCFEPDPRCAEAHRQRVSDSRCTLNAVAVGATNGRAALYLSDGYDNASGAASGSSSIRKPTDKLFNFFPRIRFDNTVDVDVVSLDSYAEENHIDHVDFIWADVQGAEIDLIAGGEKLLRRTKYLFTEFSQEEWYEGEIDADEIVRRLPGYEAISLHEGGNILLKNVSLVDV